MPFRISAVVAAAVVMGLGSATPVGAQPVPPVRPGYSSFGGIFGSNNPVAPGGLFGNTGLYGWLGGFGGFGWGVGTPGVGGVNPVIVNPLFARGLAGPLGGGLFYPGQTPYGQVLPGAIGVNPLLAPTGVVGTFNNYGHWYSPRSGFYGHWYPNGVSSGLGALSNGQMGGAGGVYSGGLGVGLGLGQMSPGSRSTLGSSTTGAGLGGQMNQPRR